MITKCLPRELPIKENLKRMKIVCSENVIEVSQMIFIRSPRHLPEYIGKMLVLAMMTLLHHVSLRPHLQEIAE